MSCYFFHFLQGLVFCVFGKKNPRIFLPLYFLCQVIFFISLQVWFSVTFFSDSSSSVFSMLCYFSQFLKGRVFCVFCKIFSQIFLLLYFPCYVIFYFKIFKIKRGWEFPQLCHVSKTYAVAQRVNYIFNPSLPLISMYKRSKLVIKSCNALLYGILLSQYNQC